jgi:hypothetical protein
MAKPQSRPRYSVLEEVVDRVRKSGVCIRTMLGMSAGAKIDHRAPRERRFVAV